MSPSRRRPELRMDQPLERGRIRGPSYDPEQWGRLSERIARFIGSWRFIAWMTAVIVTWLLWNIFAPDDLKPDPYPFIFLTLLLSLQASYAAPLILLAQNRQADRDKVQYLEDRELTDRLVADLGELYFRTRKFYEERFDTELQKALDRGWHIIFETTGRSSSSL